MTVRALNHATVRGVDPEGAAAAAAAVGYDAVGLWAMDLPADLDALAALRERLPLPVVEIDVAAAYATPEQAADGLPALRDAARKAVALDCTLVVTAAPPGPLDDGTDAAVAAAAEAVAEEGARLALEPLCQAVSLATPGAVAALLARIDHPSAAIALDTFHAAVAGAPVAEIAEAAPRVAIVHAADAPDLPRERLLEPHRHRVAPGTGVQPIAGYLGALAAAGWAGPFSVDVFNEDLWARDATEVARESLQALDRLLGDG
jgi:4-hydroxyphenylpyruvate dioxygenase